VSPVIIENYSGNTQFKTSAGWKAQFLKTDKEQLNTDGTYGHP
jgi:hypothetical protein